MNRPHLHNPDEHCRFMPSPNARTSGIDTLSTQNSSASCADDDGDDAAACLLSIHDACVPMTWCCGGGGLRFSREMQFKMRKVERDKAPACKLVRVLQDVAAVGWI